MQPIKYIDRQTGNETLEKVYGGQVIKLLYGDSLFSRSIGRMALPFLAKSPLSSWFFGYLQRLSSSKRKIKPFIEKFEIDPSEFLLNISDYTSFDDFFTRKLKPEARPIASGDDVATIPADGRYLFYPRVDQADGFIVKGKKFELPELLQDPLLAKRYERGSMVLARLCPTDYHRFHFPCRCLAKTTSTINGWLFSVNRMALKRNVKIYTENKRTLCELQTERFGNVLFMEIGAQCVGRIVQTYLPEQWVDKGAEKGFFSFGASSLILLFEQDAIHFDNDLLDASAKQMEIRCLMGQSMGRSGEVARNALMR